MGFKTVVVGVNGSADSERRVRLASQLARMFNGRLVGAAGQHGRAALDRFERQCEMLDLPSYESLQLDDRPASALVLQSRYADVVVVGQLNPEQDDSRNEEETPESIAMSSARPVLVVPYAGHFEAPFQRILVAWDGSMEATRAVTAAIPLMRRAGKVTLAIFNAGRDPGSRASEPGADMALYLARHGIEVEVSAQVTEIDIGSALLSFAADIDADLLVMGCYGHSRIREIMLGGATRTILQSMTLPVLMAH